MDVTMIIEHLFIILISVIFTTMVGIPLGIFAYLSPPARRIILRTVEILQTIPALALLGVIMVFVGPGKLTVVIGLVLYSLLPVVHNTCLGFDSVNNGIRESALGMGMTNLYRLIHVEFPIAFPMIFTGLRIATVTSVGVAVFATFVGGGGLGSAIYRGIHIQSMPLILSSTIALMIIAITLDAVMAMIEKCLKQKP